MPFDPNAFLQKYGTPAEGGATPTGFDPDAFVKKYAAPQPTENLAVTSGPNPLDPQQPAPVQAAQPAPTPVAKEEPGLLNDISKGFQRIPASLAEQYEGIFTRKTAQMAKGNQVQTALYNMIDAGQIKSDSDLDKAYLKLLYGKDQLSPKEILAHGNLKQSLAAADAYEYMNSSPEHRAAMRKGVETAASQSLTRFEESRARSKEREAELEKLAPRVKQFTDIGSPYEAASWAAGRLPEFVGTNLPQIAAGYFTGPGGLALTSVIPELSGGTKERVKYMEGIVKDEPDPAKRSQALIDYINKTQDVTLQAAVLNGLTDMIIGPEAEAVKLGVQSAFRQEVRKEILKKLPKVVGGEALGEGATGGIQEITNMVAERSLGEMQGGVFTAENAKRIINSMADEALGGAGVSTGVQLTKAALAKKNLADTDTPEGRAMRGLDDLANRESAGTTEEVPVPSTEGEIVPGAGVTQVEAKGILENLTTQLGRDPTDQEFEDAYDDYISQRDRAGAAVDVTAPVVDKKEVEQIARGGWFELSDAERLELQGDLQFLKDSGRTITINSIPEEIRAKLSNSALINLKSALNQDVDATIAALTPSSKKETTTGGEDVTAPITDADGAGAENIGEPPQGTGAGIPPSSEGTGLGVSDTSIEGTGTTEGIQPHTLTRKQFQEANTDLQTFNNIFSSNFEFKETPDELLANNTENDIRLASKFFGLSPVKDIKHAATKLAKLVEKMKIAEKLDPAQVAEMKLPELKELAKSLGVSLYGNKSATINHINNFYSNLEGKFEEELKNYAHEQAVRKAAQKGEPISDEVLKDYPDIAAYATPLGSESYTQAIKRLSKRMLPQHLMDVPNTARHLREDAEQSDDVRHASVLNDVADAMEEYYKNAFGIKEEAPAAEVPTEDKIESRPEEVTALNDTIKKGIDDKLEGLLVGDEVRFGNTPGVVVGLEGDYAKFHSAGSSNPKAYTRIPKNQLTFVSRPNTNFTSASSKEPTKFGEEAAILDVDKARITKTLGANMYASNIADVAVKELLQNSFDSIKAAVHFGEIEEGKIDIKFDSDERTITIKDNGQGMSSEIVKKAFFTIGGSNKAGVPMELQSGGFGMAKLGFIMGSESIQLDTVKDGVRTKVDATSDEIGNDNFKLMKSPAPANEHGTTLTVKIPKTYTDSRTGEEKSIYFPRGTYGVNALNRPLIGPVEVNVDFDGSEETLPMGAKFDFEATPKLTTVKFPWGSADVYFGVERKASKYSIEHRVLSSGVYQFDYDKFTLGQNEKIPYDIVVDIKSAVPATDREYPFEKSRERFNAVIEEDIASLAQYLAKVARGHEAEGLQETFKDIVTMPRTEVGEETAEASKKLKKVFDKRGDTEKGTYELPPMPKEIIISGGTVTDTKGTVLIDKEKTDDRKRKSGFEADKAAPEMAQFLVDMKQDPRQPIFHNNTNTDLLEVGRKYGNPEQFFAELGTLVVEMKEELAKSGIYTYDQLAPENLFFAGVSIDKGYGGVFIRVPFKGILLNPFYDWGAKTLFGIRQNFLNTMIHEIAHQTTGEHDRGHENAMLKIEQHLADNGTLDYFRDALLDILVKHESTFTAMREAYGRSTTKNVAKSLEDYGKSSTSTEVGGDEGSRTDTSGKLSERGGQVRGSDVRTDSGETGKSEVGRGSPKFSISNEEKILNQGMVGGDLHPTVVDAIANNDLNGALKLVADRLSSIGFKTKSGYFLGQLANRLADLNLPTGIRIGDQRNLTRRSIDLSTAPAQIQLFNFIRVAMPDVYNKYFQGYDKAENLEQVYEGLKHIQNNPKLKSVLPQYESILRSFDNNMVALKALGVYYPRFDEINLNDKLKDGLSYQTFLHEVVHAATEILLQTPANERTAEQNEAIAELEKLFNAAKDNSNVAHYGFTDLSEFIAEVFTNPVFIKELKQIPYPPARTNIFNRFVKVIMDLIGMDNVAGRAMVEAQKLFNVDRPNVPMSAGPRFAGAKGPRKKGPISSSWRTVEDTMKSVKDWEVIKNDLIPAMWDATNGVFRSTMLGVMNLRQIADVTKTKFPQIDAAIRTIEKMLAYRGKIMNDGGEIVQRWTKAQAKNLKGSQLLGRVMLEATIRGLEVDPQSKEYNVLKVNKELADAWNALGPDFQQIYRDVRDFYKRAVEETVRLMKERANNVTDPVERQELIDKIDAQFGPDKLKGPYFPLRRFGEFWFQVGEGNFKEFYMYEGRVARTIAMRVRKRELSKGNAQQRALAETISKGNGMSALYGQNVGTTKILQDVQDIVDSIGNSVVDNATGLPRDKTQDELKGEIRDSLNQLIYILLPQQSMRKMFINRKAIQGASGDMLRVFATHAVHSAYQRSRFKYAQDFMDNLSNAQKWIASFAKGDKAEVYRDYVNEVEKRSKTILGTEDTSLAARAAGKVSEAVFYFMLSAPFTAMLNLVGFAQIAMPYIGGRFGYAKTNARILENMGKYLQTAPKRTFSPLVNGAVMDMSFPSIVEGGNLTGILKDAAQQLLDEEQINISLTNDILNVGSGPTAAYTGTYNAVKRGISALFHQSERLNREITLLSVVELAYEKFMSEPIKDSKGIIKRDAQGQPMRYTDNATTSDGTTKYSQEALELAINEAKDIAGLSLGDFTRQMKPRYFTPPLLSVLTKFKQYAVLASYAVIRNAQLGLLKPFSKAELEELRGVLEEHYKTAVDKDQIIEQQMAEAQTRQKEISKEARRRLAGILGMTYLFGGYVALPFFSAVTPILVGMLAGDEDDEDEFFNWENWFKNYMETEFGGYVGAMLQKFGVDQAKARKIGSTVSDTLVYGPVSTVTGGALSDRVSLDLKNLWYRDGRYSPDTRESIVESMIANAGPVVGLTVNAADAWDMIQEGKVGRAFERMAPALFAKPVTAGRLATEGAKTKGGDVLVDELTTTEIALQAIGLQPLRVAKAQKASIETVEKVQKIQDQYSSIMNRLWMERNNPQEFNDALEKLNEFAMKHPGYKINGNTIKESFKKRTEDAALADVFGARIPKPLQSDPTVTNMPNYGKD